MQHMVTLRPMMKKILLVPALLLVLGAASCSKEEPLLTKEQVKFKVDSISKAHAKESEDQAIKDLNYRMKIEVKVKADSIVSARLSKAGGDTVKQHAVPQPTPQRPLIPTAPLPKP